MTDLPIKRLRVTKGQGLLMIDLGLDQRLGVDVSRSMGLTNKDLDTILRYVPRRRDAFRSGAS